MTRWVPGGLAFVVFWTLGMRSTLLSSRIQMEVLEKSRPEDRLLRYGPGAWPALVRRHRELYPQSDLPRQVNRVQIAAAVALVVAMALLGWC